MLEEAGQRKTGMTLSPPLHQREHLNSPIGFLFVFERIAFRKNLLGLFVILRPEYWPHINSSLRLPILTLQTNKIINLPEQC